MDTRTKILIRPTPAELAERFPPGDGKIVSLRGRFEILGASIVRQIEAAATQTGWKALAIVAGDAPADKLLLAEGDRAQLAAALNAVDAVVICDEAETGALIAALQPARDLLLDESDNRGLIADVLRRHESG